mgnify:CR=1 FL=1
MSFQDFESKLMKQNKYIMFLSAGSILFFALILSLLVGSKNYFIYRGGDFFKERLLAKQVCKESFDSITEGEPNPLLVSDGILDILEEKPFDVKVSKYLKVNSLDTGACKVILDSEGELLSFKVTMLEDAGFPFYYKLNQIDELPIEEKDI